MKRNAQFMAVEIQEEPLTVLKQKTKKNFKGNENKTITSNVCMLLKGVDEVDKVKAN